MTVEQLIVQLEKFPKQLPVGIWDAEFGFYPPTTVSVEVAGDYSVLEDMDLPKETKFIGISSFS